MTDIRSYIHYFQQLAQQHVDIRDFFIMDINEPLNALKDTMRYPALILSSPVGKMLAPNLDNTLDEISGGFLIIDHLESVDDFFGEMLMLQEMKQLGTDVISRMLHDHQKCELIALKAIPGFDINTVNYEMMGPVFDNDFGFLFTFKLISTIDIAYDASKWDEEKVITGKYPY